MLGSEAHNPEGSMIHYDPPVIVPAKKIHTAIVIFVHVRTCQAAPLGGV
jgi:hypothetical protein